MPTAKLTKRSADAAQPAAKAFIIYDTDLPGFGLRVSPTGHRTWICEYRPVGGGRRVSSRRMSLGSGAKLTADEARRMAKDILARVRLGEDPAGDRQAKRTMPTLAKFAETFIEEVCKPPRMKPSTIRLYTDNLRRLIVPQIGKIALDALTRADVARVHRKIGAKHATSANNALVTLASLFKFAVAEGLVPEGTNPARGVQRFKSKAKERFLTTAELARLGDAIREGETTGLPWELNDLEDKTKAKHRPKEQNRIVVVPPDVAAALRLLILTGCRKTEILGLRWSEVDIERGLLNLDAKTGRRSVILNAPALAILSALPRVGSFVFPGQTASEPRRDITGIWYRVRKAAKLDGSDGTESVRLHDLRHSFASFGVGGGMGLPIVGKLLGHTQSATTARYAHLDNDPVRRATDKIGATIAAAMGESLTTPAEIVPLAKRRG